MNNGLEGLIQDYYCIHQLADLLNRVNKKQLLTYLRLSKKPLGLLINFNEVLLKDGITRIISSPPEAD